MKLTLGKMAAAALAAGALTAAVPAAAATFAQVGVTSGVPTLTLTNTGGGGASLSGSGALNFNFIDGTGMMGPDVAINYTLTGASTGTVVVDEDDFLRQNFTGAFNFTFANDTMFNGRNFAAGSTVFGGEFTNARFTGQIGSTTGSILAGRVTTFNNGAIVFQPGASSRFEFGLAGISPALGGSAAGGIDGFNAVLNGKFDSGGPIGIAPIPEPATWAMMMLGFGMLGGALRRRTRLGVVTTA
jgi:hypothetical protein